MNLIELKINLKHFLGLKITEKDCLDYAKTRHFKKNDDGFLELIVDGISRMIIEDGLLLTFDNDLYSAVAIFDGKCHKYEFCQVIKYVTRMID